MEYRYGTNIAQPVTVLYRKCYSLFIFLSKAKCAIAFLNLNNILLDFSSLSGHLAPLGGLLLFPAWHGDGQPLFLFPCGFVLVPPQTLLLAPEKDLKICSAPMQRATIKQTQKSIFFPYHTHKIKIKKQT